MGTRGTAPPLLISALDGCEWAASCPCPFTHPGKRLWYPLDRRLGGPQRWSGCYREEKNISLPGIKTKPSSMQPTGIMDFYSLTIISVYFMTREGKVVPVLN
jgi:hypothetical protein